MQLGQKKYKAWLQKHPKNYSGNSIQAYLADLTIFERYLAKKGQEFKLDEVQTIFEGFILDEIEIGRNYTTLRRRIASLRRYMDFLAETNQKASVDYKKLVTMIQQLYNESSEESILSETEIKSLFDFLDGEDHGFHRRDESIFRLLFLTGSSIQRILNIKLTDLNLEAKEITLTNDLDETFVARLDDKTVNSIKEYISEARANVASSSKLEALFISQQGRKISRQAVWQNLKKLGKLVGLESKLNARIIKNTAVNHILKQGLPIEQIRLMLGHKNALSTYALIRKTKKNSEES